MVAPAIVDERPSRERQLIRFLVFGVAVLIGVSGLTARLVYLQFVRSEVYQARAEQNRTVTQAIPSTRGLIFDRTGRQLRHERAELRDQDPTGRPAVLEAR